MNKTKNLRQYAIGWLVILTFLLPACTSTQAGNTWAQSVKNLCLVVDQTYPGAPADFKQPIGEELQPILARLGVNASLSDVGECPATLTIKLSIEPIAVPVSGAGECYLSGNTNTKGQATLSAPGEKTLNVRLNEPFKKPTGVRIVSSCPKKPEDAPLTSTWAKSLQSILSAWWGVPGLTAMLHSESATVRLKAVEALVEMGPQAEAAVPDLITAIDDKDYWVSQKAIDALKAIGPAAKPAVPNLIEKLDDQINHNVSFALMKITGQDLGDDPAAWRQWWEANK